MRGSTLRQLRAFSQVARHHSFARAAANLHLTPSAVSLQIKELEQTVGLTLFGRRGRVVALTPAGESLLANVDRALLALQDADETIDRLRGSETGTVSLGMVNNSGYFLPRLLAKFHALHPGIEMHVLAGNRETLLRRLANREVDIAIMGQPPDDLASRSQALAPQPLGIIASPQHCLADARAIPVSALATQNFVVREPGSGTRAAMDRFFEKAQISPPKVIELTSNESIKQAVIGQMGLAFISLHTTGLELQARVLVVLDVVGLPVLRSWHVVDVQGALLPNAAASLRQYIVEFGGDFIVQQFMGVGHRVDPPQAGNSAQI